MQVSQGDYVILNMGKKPELARISQVPEGKKGKLQATLCREVDTEVKTVLPVEFTMTEVVSILGKRPRIGSVYGAKVEPLLKTRNSKIWNEIRFYAYIDEAWEKLIVKEVAVAMHKLEKMRLDGVQLDLEIREVGGKYAGWYKNYPRRDIDKLCVKPMPNAEGLHGVVWHEYGHAIWFRRMTSKQRFEWVKLYHEYIGLQDVSESDLNKIRKQVEASGSMGRYAKEADEEQQLIFKCIMRQISQVHNMQKKHLDMALFQGESLKDFWPTSLEMSEKQVIVTDYARKNPEELFAESFQLHVEGKKLPKAVRLLMETTLGKLTHPQGAIVATKRDRPEDDEPRKKKKIKRKEGMK